MTVRYTYKCTPCDYDYVEQRAADEPQFVTICANCKEGTLVEASVEVISETVERATTPEVPAEPTE